MDPLRDNHILLKGCRSRCFTCKFFSILPILLFINCFYFFQHPEPILLNSVVLKITAWRPEEEADPPGACGATCKPGSTRQ
jgi:hypothetical protein